MRKPGAEHAGSWRGLAKGDAPTPTPVVSREVEAPKKTRKKKEPEANVAPAEPENVAVVEEAAVVEEVAVKETSEESENQTESL
jgi:hypothetical protein